MARSPLWIRSTGLAALLVAVAAPPVRADRAVALSDRFEDGTVEISSQLGMTSRSVAAGGDAAADYTASATDAALMVRVWFLSGLSAALEQGASFRRSASLGGESLPVEPVYGARDLRATLGVAANRGETSAGLRLAVDLPTGSGGVGRGFVGVSLRPWVARGIGRDLEAVVEMAVSYQDAAESLPPSRELAAAGQLNWRPGVVSLVPTIAVERVLGDGIYEDSFTRLRASGQAAIEIVDNVSAGFTAGYGRALDHRFDAGRSSIGASEVFALASFTYALDLLPASSARSSNRSPRRIVIDSEAVTAGDVSEPALAELRSHIPALRRATLSAERKAGTVRDVRIELSVDDAGKVVRASAYGTSVASELADRVEEYWRSVEHLKRAAGRQLRIVVQFRSVEA